METKICTKCGKELQAIKEFFYRQKGGKFGLRSWCKECCKQYSIDNCEKLSEYAKQYHIDNREKRLECSKQWHECKPDYTKQYYIDNREERLEYGKQYRQTENGQAAQKRAINKYREKNKLSRNMATMLYQSLKGNKTGRHWETLVPYMLEELKQHLEGLFQPEMSWDNYGKWHIDHKIPKSKFKFTNPEDKEFQECWALENLQPLWAEENLRKNDSLDWTK